jgi:ParB/RepB/Spo0J family partition protein
MPKLNPLQSEGESQSHSGHSGFVLLKPSQIEFDPITDIRSQPYSDEDIESLKASLGREGQAQPILVRPPANGDSRYRLIAGRGRVLAASDDDSPLAAYVRDVDDEAAYRLAIAENLKRKQMSPIDLAVQFRRQAEVGLTALMTSRMLQVSPATVTEHLKLLDLPVEIQSQVHRGELSSSAALTLVRVPEADRPAVVEEAGKLASEESAKSAAARTKRSAKGSSNTSKATKTSHTPVSASAKAKPRVTAKHVLKAARAKKALVTTKARSRSEILDFFTQVGGGGAYPKVMCNFANFLVDEWAKGKVADDRGMTNRWNQIAGEIEGPAKKTVKKTAVKVAKKKK